MKHLSNLKFLLSIKSIKSIAFFKISSLFIIILFLGTNIFGQNAVKDINYTEPIKDTIAFKQIITDSLFNSNQIISLLYIPINSNKYSMKLVFDSVKLIPTSKFALKNNALAAINGGFFDMDKGGSVTYFETNDSIIATNVSKQNKWGKPSNLLNGILKLMKNDSIIIEKAKPQRYYELSKNEKQALITGPVLLLDSLPVKMPIKKFVTKRHPRTCICKTDKNIIFITVDGRQKKAQGMNLYEFQKFLMAIRCIDAINLDGGGSTTMWLKDRGVVNFPSDKKGERPVSNTLIISRK